MLVPEFPIVPIFHHLPKIHKGLDPLCGRLIVLGIGSLSERLEQWMDGQLQPTVHSLPSYLRDANHLLSIMDHLFGESTIFGLHVTYPVYCSIPHMLANTTFCFFLNIALVCHWNFMSLF